MSQLDFAVRDAVVKSLLSSKRHHTALDHYLHHPDTRNRCYLVALQVAQEGSRQRVEAANLMLLSLTGFAPTDEAVYSKIIEFAKQSETEGAVYRELQRLAEAQLGEFKRFAKGWCSPRADGADGPITPLDREKNAFGVHSQSAIATSEAAWLHYTSLPFFRGPSSEHSRRIVPIATPFARECAIVASEKNRKPLEKLRKAKKIPNFLNFENTICKDFAQQAPLLCSGEFLQSKMQILVSYADNYSRSEAVATASRVFIKLLFDGYKSKLHLVPVGRYFRTVTCAFLTPLMTLIGSDYLCVKLQAYDIIVNIALQAQLFDRDVNRLGNGPWVETEVYWLLSKVMQRQLLQGERDDRVWLSAFKCTFFVMPPEAIGHFLDVRLLTRFATLGGISQTQPTLYAVLMEALAMKLCPSYAHLFTRKNSSPSRHSHGGVHVPRFSRSKSVCEDSEESQSASLGLSVEAKKAMAEKATATVCDLETLEEIGGEPTLVYLYAEAETAEARDALFTALFCAISYKRQLQQGGGPMVSGLGPGAPGTGQKSAQPNLEAVLSAALQLGLPWHLHSMLLFQPPNATREIQQQVLLDVSLSREEKSMFNTVLSEMMALFHALTQKVPDSIEFMPIPVAAEIIGKMLLEDDIVIQHTAAAAALSSIRVELVKDTTNLSGGSGQSGRNLLGFGPMVMEIDEPPGQNSTNASAAAKEKTHQQYVAAAARECMPLLTALTSASTPAQRLCATRVLSRLGIMARTQSSALKPFSQLLHLILQRETSLPNLMQVYRAVMSLLTRQVGERGEGDVSNQCISGALQAVQSAADSMGSQPLWMLYFALRQDGVPDVSITVRQARHVIVSVLAPMDIRDAASALVAWTKVMEDCYTPVAIVGSQQVIRISGIAQYDRYEAAVNEAQKAQKADVLKSAYHMASSIAYH